MTQSNFVRTQELVINWHVTEICNYRCRYCYAKWEDEDQGKDLIHDVSASQALLTEVRRFFDPQNGGNPLRKRMGWDSLRLNLAGGEPLLYATKAVRVFRHSRQLGFDASIITNGSRFNAELIAELAPLLSWVGLSLDSLVASTNQSIGRSDSRSRMLSMAEITDLVALARTCNPNLRLKINTVVNALNWHENMSKLITSLDPDKWKVLRMLPTLTEDLAVSDREFNAFVRRHNDFTAVMRAEDNIDMAESYIMIDPHGRFFQGEVGRKGYKYSDPILDVGAEVAFAQVSLSHERFCARYSNDTESQPS